MFDFFQSDSYIYLIIAFIVLTVVIHWALWVFLIRPRIRKHQENLSQTMDRIEQEKNFNPDPEARATQDKLQQMGYQESSSPERK